MTGKISLLSGRKVLVDGERTNLPFTGDGESYYIYNAGRYTVLKTEFGLEIRWNGHFNWFVHIPGSYHNQICGLCGKWDGDKSNDFTLRDKSTTKFANKFGNNWVASGYGCSGEKPPDEAGPDDPCGRAKFKAEAAKQCNILKNKNGPLKSCFGVMDDEVYLKTCQEDVCLAKEGGASKDEISSIRCTSVSSFVDECLDAGVGIAKWRSNKLCPMKCGKHARYNLRMSSCQETCTGKPKKCKEQKIEGCECEKGYVLSGDDCVDEKQCGCTDESDGKYYKARRNI
ncbi:zonadhesin-like [Amphiura filiformis]|uniref:zonadhesin-like n=1 Tax=Amphiura filiformis TaxID=82378 RepID=UPI003B215FF3